jgi:hypothetical protein
MMGSMMRRGSFGDGATLDLAFTTMNSTADLTAAGFTFTRSSSATYINASGLLVVAGSNVARFDYDPTNVGTPRGLLIEGSATNLICHSETFASSGGSNNWTTSSATLGSLIFEDPEGTFTAPSLFASASNGTLLNNAGLSSAQRTFSIWLKRVNGTGNVQLTLDNSTWTTVTITPNWARYQITATSTGHVGIRLQTSGDGVHIFGAQLETGSAASSYIVTGTSTGNRAADECQLLNLTTMGFNANAGTIYIDVGSRLNSSGRTYTFLPTSGTADQIFEGGGSALNVYTSGAFVAQLSGSTINAQKIAAAYATNDFASSTNGASVLTDTVGILPTTLTKLTIGGSIANPAGYFSGRIRVLKYWPTRLSNAQLQALTT